MKDMAIHQKRGSLSSEHILQYLVRGLNTATSIKILTIIGVLIEVFNWRKCANLIINK